MKSLVNEIVFVVCMIIYLHQWGEKGADRDARRTLLGRRGNNLAGVARNTFLAWVFRFGKSKIFGCNGRVGRKAVQEYPHEEKTLTR